MYAVPDVDEAVAVAKELGLHLSPDEAVLYRRFLMEQLSQLDAFVQARVEEPRPPLVAAGREPGWRPSPAEDPLNAWMWKCRIEGAADCVLRGKTVSFKDHIAIAGMPMSFGSFALEGFISDFDATVVTRVLQAGGTIIGKSGCSRRRRRRCRTARRSRSTVSVSAAGWRPSVPGRAGARDA
jgi:amidase